ncbi:hypothetical protein SprV_0902695300 [Sparganum proliferum]
MTSNFDVFAGAVSIAGRVNVDVVDEQEGALLTGNFEISEVAQKVSEVARGEYCGPTVITGGAECYDGLTLQLAGKGNDIKVVVNDVMLTDDHGGTVPAVTKKFTSGKVQVEVLEGGASTSNPTVISLKFSEPVTMKWVAEYVDDPSFSFGEARRPSIQFTSDAYKLLAMSDGIDAAAAESKRLSREVIGRAEQRLTAHEGRTRVASRQLAQTAICHAENRFFDHEARSVQKLDSVAPRSMQARLFTPASTERAQVSWTKSLEGKRVLMSASSFADSGILDHPKPKAGGRPPSYDASSASTTTSYKDIAFNAQEHASRLTAATAHCRTEDGVVGSSNSAVWGLIPNVTSLGTGTYFDEETSVTDPPTTSSTGSKIRGRAQSTDVRGSQTRCAHARHMSCCRQQTTNSGQSITLMQSLGMTASMLRSYAASTGTSDAQAFLPFIQLVEEISQRQRTKAGEALDLATSKLLQTLLAEAMQRFSAVQVAPEKCDIRVRPCSHSRDR